MVSAILSLLQKFAFVWFDSLRPSRQFFSHVGMGLNGFDQY